ncbi:uncharacterized protein RJT20DRAFT_136307 [Scheffersomyces xylosifermentans]|uniref:uncharacterized protein n=1 Tax=Scheffersomyces xylosifermentans TaxID=1304137 RepID=UPI00315CDF85
MNYGTDTKVPRTPTISELGANAILHPKIIPDHYHIVTKNDTTRILHGNRTQIDSMPVTSKDFGCSLANMYGGGFNAEFVKCMRKVEATNAMYSICIPFFDTTDIECNFIHQVIMECSHIAHDDTLLQFAYIMACSLYPLDGKQRDRAITEKGNVSPTVPKTSGENISVSTGGGPPIFCSFAEKYSTGQSNEFVECLIRVENLNSKYSQCNWYYGEDAKAECSFLQQVSQNCGQKDHNSSSHNSDIIRACGPHSGIHYQDKDPRLQPQKRDRSLQKLGVPQYGQDAAKTIDFESFYDKKEPNAMTVNCGLVNVLKSKVSTEDQFMTKYISAVVLTDSMQTHTTEMEVIQVVTSVAEAGGRNSKRHVRADLKYGLRGLPVKDAKHSNSSRWQGTDEMIKGPPAQERFFVYINRAVIFGDCVLLIFIIGAAYLEVQGV